MRQDKKIGKILKIFLIVTVFLMGLQHADTVYAANLRYYNYNTKSYVNYNGQQVTYNFNNRNLSLKTPGIIVNGTALADYEALFVNEIGLTATRNNNSITLTDGKTTVTLTVGSNNVTVNGQKQTITVAPIKLKFDDSVDRYYVPTRFVTEAFGLNYIWNGNNNSVKITKTLNLSINNKNLLYSGTFYLASYMENSINMTLPMIYYNNEVYAPAKCILEAVGCHYEEKDTAISVTKGNISISMQLNSDTALVNNYEFAMDTAPAVVTEKNMGISTVYVPLEFITKVLGFELTYQDAENRYTIIETDYTGKPELHPELKNMPTLQMLGLENEKSNVYFDWIPEQTVVSEQKKVTRVMAYSIEDADVLEIYGITREDIYDFIDNQTLIFELKSVLSDIETQFFMNYEAPHLNYVLLTTINDSTRFIFMIPPDNSWHFVEKENCIQVYFMSDDLSLEDLNISSEEPETYPEDKLVIPVPEELLAADITDLDNYLSNNFQIMISGNHYSFYEQHQVINPYNAINNISITYDTNKNQTILTFKTNYVCGYQYTLENGYLAVTVAKPSELYNKIIVLDAGHGGKDPGAVDATGTIMEKTINFNVLCNYAKELFKDSDIKVYFTRETDTFISLENRAKFAAKVEADLFISLHINSSVYASANGTEVYYSGYNNSSLTSGLNSYRMAKTLVNNLCSSLGSTSRGTKKANFYVIRYNSVPAVLIELGFISNPTECAKMNSPEYQKKTAETIYQSVIEIFSAYPTGR